MGRSGVCRDGLSSPLGVLLIFNSLWSGVIMDGFDSVIFLWFASVMLVTAIGYFRGQAADAMTLGVLLGPIALVVTVVLVVRARRNLHRS